MKKFKAIETKEVNKLVLVTLHGTVTTEMKHDGGNDPINDLKISMDVSPYIQNGENVHIELLASEDNLTHHILATDTTLCKKDVSDPQLERQVTGHNIWSTRSDAFYKDVITYYEVKSLFDKIPSENAVVLDIRATAYGVKNANSIIVSIREVGDMSILSKLTEFLSEDAYKSVVQTVENIFAKENIVLPEINSTINSYYSKVREAVNDKLSNFPVFKSDANINNYGDYVIFNRDLKYYSFEKDLLRCIVSAIDELKIRNDATDNSRDNFVRHLLYVDNTPCHAWYSVIRNRYSGIFDVNNVYIDPNVEFNVDEFLDHMNYECDVYCEYVDFSDEYAIGKCHRSIPCTTTDRMVGKLAGLSHNILSFKTSEFFKSIDIVKEFRDVVEKKLAKHKEPGINMTSCTMDNISSFVEARFNRMDILNAVLLSCNYYIDIYNRYNHKEFIPIGVATGDGSNYRGGLSELGIFFAKTSKLIGNGDMYKGLNPILKELEMNKISQTVDYNHIPRDFMGSYAGEILMNDPSRTDIADIMAMSTMITTLYTKMNSDVISDAVDRLVFKKEFLDKVKEFTKQVNTKDNNK